MTFETWLEQQKDREDYIGDIARDFISIKMNGPSSHKNAQDSIHALNIAFYEYQQDCGNKEL